MFQIGNERWLNEKAAVKAMDVSKQRLSQLVKLGGIQYKIMYGVNLYSQSSIQQWLTHGRDLTQVFTCHFCHGEFEYQRKGRPRMYCQDCFEDRYWKLKVSRDEKAVDKEINHA